MAVIDIGRNYQYWTEISDKGSKNIHVIIENVPDELWCRLDDPDGDEWIDTVLAPYIDFEDYPKQKELQVRTAKEAGEYLEQIVKQRGKTAEDLAELLDTTVEKINGVFAGEVFINPFTAFEKMCDYLSLDPLDFIYKDR